MIDLTIVEKSKILCIDDEEPILRILRRSLQKNYEVLTANNGIEGISLYDANPDLTVVTTDMNMPGLSGLDVLTHIANRYRGVSTLLIASCQPDEIEKARRLGADYISKPFELELVKEMVKAAYIKNLRTK
ncbi:response regulator [Candidatus Woesearchaeota archaeon]|nr:response regulator [Candidatus Woesearchaeota archaeon]